MNKFLRDTFFERFGLRTQLGHYFLELLEIYRIKRNEAVLDKIDFYLEIDNVKFFEFKGKTTIFTIIVTKIYFFILCIIEIRPEKKIEDLLLSITTNRDILQLSTNKTTGDIRLKKADWRETSSFVSPLVLEGNLLVGLTSSKLFNSFPIKKNANNKKTYSVFEIIGLCRSWRRPLLMLEGLLAKTRLSFWTDLLF